MAATSRQQHPEDKWQVLICHPAPPGADS